VLSSASDILKLVGDEDDFAGEEEEDVEYVDMAVEEGGMSNLTQEAVTAMVNAERGVEQGGVAAVSTLQSGVGLVLWVPSKVLDGAAYGLQGAAALSMAVDVMQERVRAPLMLGEDLQSVELTAQLTRAMASLEGGSLAEDKVLAAFRDDGDGLAVLTREHIFVVPASVLNPTGTRVSRGDGLTLWKTDLRRVVSMGHCYEGEAGARGNSLQVSYTKAGSAAGPRSCFGMSAGESKVITQVVSVNHQNVAALKEFVQAWSRIK